jgi:hypothetical protein
MITWNDYMTTMKKHDGKGKAGWQGKSTAASETKKSMAARKRKVVYFILQASAYVVTSIT